MNVLIIEDEPLLADMLESCLVETDPEITVDKTSSIKESVKYFETNPEPDCVFSDIRLGDGLAFEIFDRIHIKSPVIFATAYDEYAIRAFEYNCIGYVLKPVTVSSVQKVLEKYHRYEDCSDRLSELRNNFKFRKRLFLKKNEDLIVATVDEIVYFNIESGTSKAFLSDGSWAFVEESLAKVMKELDPGMFFRANRQTIVNIDHVGRIRHRLFRDFEIYLKPPFDMISIKISGERNSELLSLISDR